MLRNINLKQYGVALRGLFLLVIMAVVITVMPGNVSAQFQSDKISVISEDGVPAQFTDDIERAALYTEKFYKERYGIDFKNNIRIIITPTREAFAEARMREGGETREKAERHAKVASGTSFGEKNVILLNAGHAKMAVDREKRVKTTIHELTHQIQSQLSNNRQSAAGYMWMSEGTANALAFRVMEMGGFSTVEEQRAQWLKELIETPKLPAVYQVINKPEWIVLMETKANPYGLSTNMTEFLIDECGYDAIIEYFRLLGSNDREVAFEQAFGMTAENFHADFNAYYQREIPNAPK